MADPKPATSLAAVSSNADMIAAFREAARIGLDDLDAGRFEEVSREGLGEYIAALAHEAESRARKPQK